MREPLTVVALLGPLFLCCAAPRAPEPVVVTCVSRVEPVACPRAEAPPSPVAASAGAVVPRGPVLRWGASWQRGTVVGGACRGIMRVHFADDPEEATEFVSARDVQEYDAQGRTPEIHTPPPGTSVDLPVVVRPRDALLALSGGTWYPARALRLGRDGTVRIHYDGYGSDDDEDLPRSSLRRPDPEPLTHPPGRSVPQGDPLDTSTPLLPGARVEALARQRWFDARVLQAECDDLVRVRLIGWEPAWDAVVPRARLRLPPP